MGSLVGQTLLGKYRIDDRIGEGGMCTVFRGMHTATQRRIAVKVLDEKFVKNSNVVKRFGREARAASAVHHPGIVEILDHDVLPASGTPFLVMEFLDGETLGRRIERLGKLEETVALHIMFQLLDALDSAHNVGVVHRDVKPDNIFLVPQKDGSEKVKILDFGISRKVDDVMQITVEGSVLGTPHYMAPEQARGEIDLDARCDIYAAAVVLYECVVGDTPFDAENYNKLLQRILHEAPTSARARGAKIRPAIERVILSALEKDRDMRPRTAREMLERLRVAAMSTSTETPAYSNPPPAGGLPAVLGFGEGDSVSSRSDVRQRSAPPVAAPAAMAVGDLVIDSPPPRPAPRPQPVASADIGGGAMAGGLGPAPSDNGLGGNAMGGGYGGGGFDRASDPGHAANRSGRLGAPSDDGALALELDEGAIARTAKPEASPRSGTFRTNDPSGLSASGTYRAPEGLRAPPAPTRPAPLRTEPHETPEHEPASRIRIVLIAVAAILVAALAVVALRYAAPSGDEREFQQITEPSGARVVRIDLVGVPRGATVVLDGLPQQTMQFRLPRGSSHTLEIRAPGFQSRTIRFSADQDRRITASLQR